ncbi:hypothetical protein [Serratia liquefaciens]|uniref:hypothetical protein n=1 Tax=Serratia liquefaciens TaxID=614 RepID=UPI002183D0B8|nr:hypothetical protein [Serratia liquefaciens]CAI2469224.1 Uncharacterised protein [Serratia liquefaciens]
MKRVLLSLFLILFSCIVKGETLDGYGNSKWGMSPQQVIYAEGGRAHLLKPPVKYYDSFGLVSIDSVEIGSSDYEVSYLFDKNNRLVQVNVSSKEKSNNLINESNFKTVESLLTQKYGSPVYREDSVKSIWNVKGTTIELDHVYIANVVTKLTISYLPEKVTKSKTNNI